MIKIKKIGISVLLVLLPSITQANCLIEVAAFAKEICGEFERNSETLRNTIDGEITGELNGLVKKIVGKGKISIKAAKKTDSYTNVLRKHLHSELWDIRTCKKEMVEVGRQEVCEKNTGKNLSSSSSKQLRQYGAIAYWKIRDGDTLGAYSAVFKVFSASKADAIEGAMSSCKKRNGIGCAISATFSGKECAVVLSRDGERDVHTIIGSTSELTSELIKGECPGGDNSKCTILMYACATKKT